MTAESAAKPWPVELKLDPEKKKLTVAFDNGHAFALAAEYLRVESPSAEVKGHAPGQRQIIGGKRDVRITSLEPVGNYAVRISFDDGHGTGLFTWDYLYELGSDHNRIWDEYLRALRVKGLYRG
ncbi:MAG TPA: DUF971 domain-containing protein [Rhizomicrobium sp.]|jgi:DUF971 family protein|nr:DUF971 domain-containing protein [Rhizomicrobium sp.]